MFFKKIKQNNKKKEGFTLIELLVVISIIGLLSTIVLASLQNVRRDAKWRKFESELVQIRTAVQLYREKNNGNWPNKIMAPDSSLDDLANELKSAGLYPRDKVDMPENGVTAGVYPSYKLGDSYVFSCGNPGYQDVYAIIYFGKTPYTYPIPYTKIPILYENGYIYSGIYLYCIEFR